ncbi:MAG: hypothetical protein KGL59_14800 [Acidobacteriota bacterium]|nr:hypothetical protein [Acidobacteriota bacterium]
MDAMAEAAGDKSPAQLTQADVLSAVEKIKTKYSGATVYHAVGKIRTILQAVVEAGGPKLKAKTPRPRPRATLPTEEELTKLKQIALPWQRAWLILQAECGLRISETLRVCDRRICLVCTECNRHRRIMSTTPDDARQNATAQTTTV